MSMPQADNEVKVAGLAVATDELQDVTRELAAALPSDSRIVHATDANATQDAIRELLEGGEDCVIGHSQRDLIGDLLILLARLRQFGCIRRLCILGSPPSMEAESIAARFGMNWTRAADGTAIAAMSGTAQDSTQTGRIHRQRD